MASLGASGWESGPRDRRRRDDRRAPRGPLRRVPTAADAPDVARLLAAHQQAAKGSAGVDAEAVLGQLAGIGSWTRRQALVHDPAGRLVAWLSVHDRASGRTLVEVTVAPDLPEGAAAALAAAFFGAAQRHAATSRACVGRSTLLDSGAYADDPRQQRWLAAAGFEQTRTWLQMTRPVLAATRRRRARRRAGRRRAARRAARRRPPRGPGPAGRALGARGVLPGPLQRVPRELPRVRHAAARGPGHRWDHWWLATVETDEGVFRAGALVSSVLREDADGFEGSYVDYIGVHRRARGRGVAKALLHTVIADAARRGRNRVGLEVDADSPTGADGLYTSMGWVTDYRTQSWHRELDLR